MATQPTVDPWLDEGVSLGSFDQSFFEEMPQIAEELAVPDEPGTPKPTDDPTPDPAPAPAPTPTPAPEPAVPPSDPQPRVTNFEDGSSLTVEQTNKGWKAVLDPNIPNVNPETFYGKTKDELYVRIAQGKVNATRKIRELNKTVKLGSSNPAPVQKVTSSRAQVRDLTPDEIFEYKTLHESDPVKAFDYYNEKRYGLKPQEFARKLNEGTLARQLGDIDSVARSFASQNPDYYPTTNNLYTMVRYLVRKTFNRGLSADEDFDQLTIDLLENGAWTVENLETAKDDLLASELLEAAPRPQRTTPSPRVEKPAPAPVAAVPPPATPPAQPVNEPARISPQPTVRTRAGNLGIRVVETRNPVATDPPPPVEDVNQWTDDAVEEALKQLRLSRRTQR